LGHASLREVLESIGKKCSDCPLSEERAWRLVLIKPASKNIRAMVVSESPGGRAGEVERLVSAANVPTFPYIYTVTGGLFAPLECDYWTHVCKCYLKDVDHSVKRKAISVCSGSYLRAEVEAARPRLILAVGEAALKFFAKEAEDKRLKGRLIEVFRRQAEEGVYRGLRVGSASFSLTVLPHPSGRSRFWNRLMDKDLKAFNRVVGDVKAILTEP